MSDTPGKRDSTDCGGGLCSTVGWLCDACAEQAECPTCEGTGHEERIDWSDADVPCSHCGGTGLYVDAQNRRSADPS